MLKHWHQHDMVTSMNRLATDQKHTCKDPCSVNSTIVVREPAEQGTELNANILLARQHMISQSDNQILHNKSSPTVYLSSRQCDHISHLQSY